VNGLRQNRRRFRRVAHDDRLALCIAFGRFGILLADDVPGAVGNRLVNEIVAVAGRAFDGYEDVSGFHESRVRSDAQ
jgi:hypothetical protein